tara:strand:+ start:178 stop:393 length:216 start_codon:yes stop_codon:yes gene_type:complete
LLVVVEDMLVQVSPLVVLVVLVEVVLVVYLVLTHLQEKVALTERSQQEAAVVLLAVLELRLILVELVVLVL